MTEKLILLIEYDPTGEKLTLVAIRDCGVEALGLFWVLHDERPPAAAS